jgi:hypothetical protein
MTKARFRVFAHAEPTELQVQNALRSSISGTLFVELDDTCFPARGWGDYVVPVLGWWMENAMRLNLPDSEVKYIVMDGPYEMRMRRATGSDDVTTTLWWNGRKLVDREYVISYGRCLAMLRGAAKSVLNELKELGFRGDGEASTLQSRLEHVVRLESEIKAHGLP